MYMEKSVVYEEGYRKALMDVYVYFQKWEPQFRSDRKRNNVKNVVWLLECLLENVPVFARFGSETPIHFQNDGKKLKYYIKNEWPIYENPTEKTDT